MIRPFRLPPRSTLSASEETPWRLETATKAAAEDRLRLRRLEHFVPINGVTWTNIRHVLWTHKHCVRSPVCPDLNSIPLTRKFKRADKAGKIPKSLGSSRYMRKIRRQLIKLLKEVVVSLPNEQFCTFTIVNSNWILSPTQLQTVSTSKILNQFRTHLNRAGILKMPGPFICFLHSEFEPTAGVFVLHLHGLTTEAKAKALHLLKGTKERPGRWGYGRTPTKARPVVVKLLKNSDKQISYLLQSFWPGKPVIEVRPGVRKRVREKRRIPEPFHTQSLLWLDRNKLRDLALLSDVWSPRKGGGAAMRDVYLFVKEH